MGVHHVEFCGALMQPPQHRGRVVDASDRCAEVMNVHRIYFHRALERNIRHAIAIDIRGEHLDEISARRKRTAQPVDGEDWTAVASCWQIGGHDVKDSQSLKSVHRVSAEMHRIRKAALVSARPSVTFGQGDFVGTPVLPKWRGLVPVPVAKSATLVPAKSDRDRIAPWKPVRLGHQQLFRMNGVSQLHAYGPFPPECYAIRQRLRQRR